MKRTASLIVIALVVSIFASAAQAKDVPLYGKDAEMHRIVSANPGAVQVPTHYDKAIKVKKLGKNDVGYWNPDGGKYITAGEYAFVWAKIINTKDGSAKYHWVAINKSALDQALELMHRFAQGVAFYKLTQEGNQVIMVAYPYDTLHAIGEGEKTVDVKE